MSTAQLLIDVRSFGVELSVVEGRLKAKPQGMLPDNLKAQLAANKEELLALLAPLPELPFEGEYSDSDLWRNLDALYDRANRCIEHPDADEHPVIVEAAKELLRLVKACDAKCFDGPEAAQEWLNNHGARATSLVANIDSASRASKMLVGRELEALGREIFNGAGINLDTLTRPAPAKAV